MKISEHVIRYEDKPPALVHVDPRLLDVYLTIKIKTRRSGHLSTNDTIVETAASPFTGDPAVTSTEMPPALQGNQHQRGTIEPRPAALTYSGFETQQRNPGLNVIDLLTDLFAFQCGGEPS